MLKIAKLFLQLPLPILAGIIPLIITPRPGLAQVIRPYTPRFQIITRGDLVFAGNTLMTCTGACTAVQNSNDQNNNMISMNFVDVDGLGSNSSTTNLNLPANAEVLFAGLYWGAYTDINNPTHLSDRHQILFKVPGSNYTQISALNCPSVGVLPVAKRCQLDLGPSFQAAPFNLAGLGQPYQGFAEVTGFLPDGNGDGIRTGSEINGTYGVGNVQARVGIVNMYAGWNMVIIYRDPSIPITSLPKSLQVYDGFSVITNGGTNSVTTTLADFNTPPSGTVEVKLGAVVYEGDGGIPGETFSINGNAVDDFAPAGDVFNGTIITNTTVVPSRNPSYTNQLGIDLDILNANGLVGNNVNSLNVAFSTNQNNEGYWPGVLSLSISTLGEPNLRLVKRITNVTRNGVTLSGVDFQTFVDNPNDSNDNASGWSNLAQGNPIGLINLPVLLQRGDEVEYTVYYLSDGTDTADNIRLCDPIPVGSTFIEDSFGTGLGTLVSNRTIGLPNQSLTNQNDGDRATYFPPLTPVTSPCNNPNNPNGSLVIQLGTIYNNSPSNVGLVRFKVKVN